MQKANTSARKRTPGRFWGGVLSVASLMGIGRRSNDTKGETADSGRPRPPAPAAASAPTPRVVASPASGQRADSRPQSIATPAPNAGPAKPSDDDTENEIVGNGPLAQARRRERARCEAILGCEAAAWNFALAKGLAFDTRMPRQEAIALLEASPAAPEAGISWQRSRDRARRNPRVGSDGPAVSAHAAGAASWDAAFAKANPAALGGSVGSAESIRRETRPPAVEGTSSASEPGGHLRAALQL
jgi:hypothetical protein